MSSESEVLAVLKVLRQDAKVRQERLDQLNGVIRMYESELVKPDGNANDEGTGGSPPLRIDKTGTPPSERTELTIQEKYPDFPKDEHLIYQIPYVVKQKGIATKLKAVQDVVNEVLGREVAVTEHQMRNNIDKLLEKGELLRVKFNKSNSLVYYLLPDWVEFNENGDKMLKEEYKPSKKEIPTGFHSIEFH